MKRSLVAFHFTRRLRGFTCRPYLLPLHQPGFTCRPLGVAFLFSHVGCAVSHVDLTFYLYTRPVSHVDDLAFHIVGCAVSHVDHLAFHMSTAVSHVNHGTISHVFESDFTWTGCAVSGWFSCICCVGFMCIGFIAFHSHFTS